MPSIARSRIRDFTLAGMGLALVATAAFAVERQDSSSRHGVQKHTVSYPQLDPSVVSGCAAEAAAYAQALTVLEAAEIAADEAFDAWMECDYEEMTPDAMPEPLSEAYSVLIKD